MYKGTHVRVSPVFTQPDIKSFGFRVQLGCVRRISPGNHIKECTVRALTIFRPQIVTSAGDIPNIPEYQIVLRARRPPVNYVRWHYGRHVFACPEKFTF